MKNVWILIANAENAYIYSVSENKIEFNLIQSLHHSESKLKKTDLVSDRPGHYAKGYGSKIRGSYSLTTDPKLLETEHFAKYICDFLEQGRINNSYIGLIVVTDPHFYGLIKKSSTKQLIKYIKYHIAKDYSGYQYKVLEYKLTTDLIHKIRSIFLIA